jgi:tungstate transport system substrate-binding protein
MRLTHSWCCRGLLLGWLLWLGAVAHAQTLVLASTTSTEQSGLLRYLLPQFRQATGIDVKVVALGTGQALDMARRGDADVLLVHDPQGEARLVAEGFALDRREVMRNDYLLVGPRADPAGARGADIVQALQRVAAAQAPFVSRGDRSGTHAAEERFWHWGGSGRPAGRWYRACGCGMGQALNIAAAGNAYVLTDRATWMSFRNRQGLEVLVEGDERLLNPYSVLRVDPARHPHVRQAEARAFVDWLTGTPGQRAIARFRIDGQTVFVPVAIAPGS